MGRGCHRSKALIVGVTIYATSYWSPAHSGNSTSVCLCPESGSCSCASENNTPSPSGGTTTINTCPSGTCTTSTTTMTTASAATTSAATSSSDGLEFSLTLKSNGGVNITVGAQEFNPLGSENNVTAANNWSYPNSGLLCGANEPEGNFVAGVYLPMEISILHGDYGPGNYTSGTALTIDNTGGGYTCGSFVQAVQYYVFAPDSDNASFYFGSTKEGAYSAFEQLTVDGYLTPAESTSEHTPFQPGTYTVLAEDEWGNVLLLHFTVYTTLSTGGGQSPESPVRIVSVALVNTTVGSHLVFDVTFENVGNSTVYYVTYHGRTTPVSASIASSPAISPQTTATGEYDCMRTISAVALAPAASASAETTDCVDASNYEITSAGTIQATVNVTWWTSASAVLSEKAQGTTSLTQEFAVGTTSAPGGGRLYEVVFKQSGSCSPALYASPWAVTLGPWTVAEPSGASLPINSGTAGPSNADTSVIIFSVPNGEYNSSEYGFENASGTVTVNGSDVTIILNGPETFCTSTSAAGE